MPKADDGVDCFVYRPYPPSLLECHLPIRLSRDAQDRRWRAIRPVGDLRILLSRRLDQATFLAL